MLLGRNAELGGGEVRHRGAGRLVEGYLSTLLPRHNEARERARQSDRAQRSADRTRASTLSRQGWDCITLHSVGLARTHGKTADGLRPTPAQIGKTKWHYGSLGQCARV